MNVYLFDKILSKLWKDYPNAVKRAKRRKSPWNLLLIPLVCGLCALFTIDLFRFMWHVHVFFYPAHRGALSEFWNEGLSLKAFASSFLLAVPLFFAALPLAMICTNLFVWFIPQAKKTFEKEAQGYEGTSFRDSMKGIVKISIIVVPICLILSFIGAVTLSSLK